MSAYIVAEINVVDLAAYNTYRALNTPIVEAFGGRFLVRTTDIEELEGKWHPERLVIIEFPSEETAKRWWSSDDYRAAKQIRQQATLTKMIVVRGV